VTFTTSLSTTRAQEGNPPAAPPTGVFIVDAVVAAALAGDVDTLLPLVGYESFACSTDYRRHPDGAPLCTHVDPATATTTTVEALLILPARGRLLLADDLPHYLQERLAGEPHALYGVLQLPPDPLLNWSARQGQIRYLVVLLVGDSNLQLALTETALVTLNTEHVDLAAAAQEFPPDHPAWLIPPAP
jgi:hypothetical protein